MRHAAANSIPEFWDLAQSLAQSLHVKCLSSLSWIRLLLDPSCDSYWTFWQMEPQRATVLRIILEMITCPCLCFWYVLPPCMHSFYPFGHGMEYWNGIKCLWISVWGFICSFLIIVEGDIFSPEHTWGDRSWSLLTYKMSTENIPYLRRCLKNTMFVIKHLLECYRMEKRKTFSLAELSFMWWKGKYDPDMLNVILGRRIADNRRVGMHTWNLS